MLHRRKKGRARLLYPSDVYPHKRKDPKAFIMSRGPFGQSTRRQMADTLDEALTSHSALKVVLRNAVASRFHPNVGPGLDRLQASCAGRTSVEPSKLILRSWRSRCCWHTDLKLLPE